MKRGYDKRKYRKEEKQMKYKKMHLREIQEEIYIYIYMKVKVIQSHPTLCDPMDCTIPGILQDRILE